MDKTYLNMAHKLASKSHCIRRKACAILVPANGTHIVSSINNPFPDITLCEKNGCLRDLLKIESGTRTDICRCIHCETNVIVQCAKEGISPVGATVYTTLYPCLSCARVLIEAGIKRVVYSDPYPDDRAKELFQRANIQVDQL